MSAVAGLLQHFDAYEADTKSFGRSQYGLPATIGAAVHYLYPYLIWPPAKRGPVDTPGASAKE
jgi:hypothetical protein